MSEVPSDVEALLPATTRTPVTTNSSYLLHACAFILVTEFCERFAYYGLTASLPVFFRKHLGMTNVLATELHSLFTCVSYFTPLLGAYVADRYFGRFKSIVSFSVWYLAGLVLCTIASHPSIQSTPLFLAGLFGGVAVGVGGIKPNVVVLGADQFDVSDLLQRQARDAFFNWFYWAINVGSTCSYIFLTNLAVQGLPPLIPAAFGYFWSFLIPTIVFSLGMVVFVGGRHAFVKKPARGKRTFDSVAAILMRAGLNSTRGMLVLSGVVALLPAIALTILSYFVTGHSHLHVGFAIAGAVLIGYGALILAVFCQKTTWVVAAATHGEYSIQQVTQVAQLVRLAPFFSVLVVFWTVHAQQTMNFTLQGCQMDLRMFPASPTSTTQVSAAMLTMVDAVVVLLCVPLFSAAIYPALARRRMEPTHLRKIGAGLVVSMLAMVVAGLLEMHRKQAGAIAAINSNCAQPNEWLPMADLSVWWQLPQCFLVAIAEILVVIPSYDLFYTEVPESLRSVSQALNLLTTTLGAVVAGGTNSIFSFWIPMNLNDGHLEGVFFVLAALVL
ncbi:hypothetical protein As57867_016500, partial [Aphanomyces stellatus]